jgi:YVTN family beta-propeller protein
VLRGNRGYLPNIAASPAGPLKFNVDTQAFLNIITGVGSSTQADLTFLNLHLGARNPEPGKIRLFFSNPWAIAFTTQSGVGKAYVASAGSDLLVKLNVDVNGLLSFTVDGDTTRYIDLNDPTNPATAGFNAGKNPLGIVINAAGTRAYTANYVSGNISIVNLATDTVIKVVRTASLPGAGSLAEKIRVGAEMFFSSRGHFKRPAGTTVSTDNRLSSEGWQNCASCHPAGLTDGVIWAFNSGPRKSVNLAGTFNPHARAEQKLLNYSGDLRRGAGLRGEHPQCLRAGQPGFGADLQEPAAKHQPVRSQSRPDHRRQRGSGFRTVCDQLTGETQRQPQRAAGRSARHDGAGSGARRAAPLGAVCGARLERAAHQRRDRRWQISGADRAGTRAVHRSAV